MKMVKSLLLGSAAGLVAVTAGQAAELPVKAKPVQYVKVCSLYGAGFYYMPGTDMCIKIGGWMRAEAGYNYNASLTAGPWAGDAHLRSTSNLVERARGYITADAREQTAYGVARAYIAVGLSTNDVGLNTAANQFSANRAFLQWAGFTAGIAQSFYDFYSEAAAAYNPGNLPGSDTGDPGWWVWGYTAQFGGGFSATLAMEERRMSQIINTSAAASSSTGNVTIGSYCSSAAGLIGTNGAYGGEQVGDIVGNLRVDQAWGSAQVMGAYHNVNPTYYTVTSAISGSPGNASGWAGGAGLKVNFPMVAPGDYFQSQVNYTNGALGYVFFNQKGFNYGSNSGANTTYGIMSDCVYGAAAGAASSCQLTTAWGFNASYEHYWTPQWHQSLYGAYAAVSYGTTGNNALCDLETGTTTGLATAVTGCNNNWSTWGVGSRLQYDVTKSFYVGVDVLYTQLNGGSVTPSGTSAGTSFSGSNVTTIAADTSNWIFRVRMHKDFLP